ncbi:MAG TPA: hypothetical protein VG406_27365 [Isosphaeraceae bacterium]|jgi:hypothetical protein|nr:hypothetical protein [Isosphaeraceae bacterium]
MSTPRTFREWAEQKAATEGEQARRLDEWTAAYDRLRDDITRWMRDDGGEAVKIDPVPATLGERGIGTYVLTGLRIRIGDHSVNVSPVGRNVAGPIGTRDGSQQPEGLVYVTDGSRKYPLIRTVQDGRDVWYVAGEEGVAERLTSHLFEKILMDLMS